MRKLFAEFFGTFWLVFGGCGAAVFAAGVPNIGIGLAGVSLAFGLTVLTMAYAVGHISGGHFNPAVTFGLWASGRFSSKEIVPYIGAQLIGATAAAVTAMPGLSTPSAELNKLPPAPENGGGYSLSEHVKRYYQTARV